MNRDLLIRLLDDARDAAPTLADADEIRVLMIDLDLLPKPPRANFLGPHTRGRRK